MRMKARRREVKGRSRIFLAERIEEGRKRRAGKRNPLGG